MASMAKNFETWFCDILGIKPTYVATLGWRLIHELTKKGTGRLELSSSTSTLKIRTRDMANNKTQLTWLEIEDCYNNYWASISSSASWDPTKVANLGSSIQSWVWQAFLQKLKLLKASPILKLSILWASVKWPCAKGDIEGGGWLKKRESWQKLRSVWKCIDVRGGALGIPKWPPMR